MAASRDDSQSGGSVASNSFIVRLPKMLPWTNRERVRGRASSRVMLAVAAPDLRPLHFVLVVSIVREDTSDDDRGEEEDSSSSSRWADDGDIFAGGDAMNEARTEANDWTIMVISARTKSGERPRSIRAEGDGGNGGFILSLGGERSEEGRGDDASHRVASEEAAKSVALLRTHCRTPT
jgi:hypothetical protein